MRRVYFFMVLAMTLLPLVTMATVTVLTDKPVAEFTLPDGTVLKNAYAWKRTAEGIMIIHDGGQYYLNFKTLPDAWRDAYGVLDEVEQVPGMAEKKYDQYSIYPILETIESLPNRAVGYFESVRYNGDCNGPLLLACSAQSLLKGNRDTAVRLNNLVKQYYQETETIDIDYLFTPCTNCSGKGVIISVCHRCNGTGKCVKCGGTGEVKSEFSREDEDSDKNKNKKKPDKKADEKKKDEKKDLFKDAASGFEHKETKPCTACGGGGKCPYCKGTGKRGAVCLECKGTGKIMDSEKVKSLLDGYVEQLKEYYTDQKNRISP